MIKKQIVIMLCCMLLFSFSLEAFAFDNTEIVTNGDFSNPNQSGTGFASWNVSGTGWGSVVSADNGKVKINTSNDGNHWIRQDIGRDYLDDVLYRVNADVNIVNITGTVAIRLEYYSSRNHNDQTIIDSAGTDPLALGAGTHNISYSFTPPAGTKSIALYIRLKGFGTLYIDNVSMKQTSEPFKMKFSTDWVFYYTDWGTGKAQASVNVDDYPELTGSTVTFEIADGQTKVATQSISPDQSGNAEYNFSLSNLSTKGKKYVISAILKNGSGSVLESKSLNIYRYDRPTYLRADGVFEKNNTVIDPFFTVGIGSPPSVETLNDTKELGSKIVTVYSDSTTDRLDDLQEQGLMALVLLYRNMLPAGHESNIDNTKQKVTELMNHPALFGYAIMDEPFYNFDDPCRLLEDSYKAIRDIDPHHPVYMVEIKSSAYSKAVKYCDILCADIYPGNTSSPLTYTTAGIQKAVSAVNDKKALFILMQAFRYYEYMPTGAEMRNMIYRALFEGADGIGYYKYQNADGDLPLNQTDTGRGIISFAEKEQKIATDIFIKNKLPLTDSYEGSDVLWRTYNNGGNYYAIVLNQKSDVASMASIPTGANTKVKIINGTDTVSITDNSVNVTVPAGGAGLLMLYPEKNTNEILFLKDNLVIDELQSTECDVYFGGTGDKMALLALRDDPSRQIAKLSNPDFELLGANNLPTGWSYLNSTPGNHVLSGMNAKSGQRSLQTVGNATGNVIAYATLGNISGGQNFDISVSANNVGLGDSVSFKIEFYEGRDSTGQKLYEERIAFSRISGWQTKTCSVTVPQGSKIMYIYLCNYSAEGKKVYFDNVTIKQNVQRKGDVILDIQSLSGMANPLRINYQLPELTPGYYILTAYLWNKDLSPLVDKKSITIIKEDE